MRRVVFVCGLVIAVAVGTVVRVGAGQGATPTQLNADLFKEFKFRSLGPSLTTGRVQDIAVDPKNPSVWYIGSAAGGVWKTENRGQTFKPVFDNAGSFNISTVVVDPKDSNIVWVGTGENANPRSAMYGDGVYKSTNGGETFTRMGLEHSEHIGNIKIDPRNSNVVYVAAQGPLWAPGGDRGLYKTTDGGQTWKAIINVSPDTGVNEVQIDPTNPDILYASAYQRRRAVGQFVGGGPEGGIYKSMNAGEKWTKITKGLPTNVGRIGLALDGKVKPTRVYALVDAVTAESGFYRSDDAGLSFYRMGVPLGGVGAPAAAAPAVPAAPPAARGAGARAGAPPAGATGAGAAAPAAGAGAGVAGAAGAPAAGRQGGGGAGGRGGDGVYRGEDPHYYYEIFVDPNRPDTIWSEGLNMSLSADGGKTFGPLAMQYNSAIHVDFHAIVFDPLDKNHLIFGNDGGLYETWDFGKNVRHFDNLPVSQFYRIATDNALPFYKICGGLQDNNSMCGPSRSINQYGIRTNDWFLTGGGDGFQSRVDPEDPNIIYASSQFCGLTRLDLRTSQSKGIRPNTFSAGDAPTRATPPAGAAAGAPAGGGAGAGGAGGGGGRGGRGNATERVNWDCAYMISPHSHTRLYIGGEKVYRSDDRGDTWTPISPDLTRDVDPLTTPIMGKVWDPATTVSYNRSTTQVSTIVSIDESPLLEGLIYIGTDDGLVQVTEDGGKNWRKTDTFPGVPAGTYVTDVFASPLDSNVVFIAMGNHQRGDFKPYVLRSSDRGKTFTSIVGDLPVERNNVWTIAQDHVNRNLLFAGGEFGVFFTVDGGSHWIKFTGGLPTTQVRDIAIQRRENDLVLGTFGRGVYVLDDYSALREINADTLGQEVQLLPVRTTYAYNEYRLSQASTPMVETPNPPVGATISYYVSPTMTGNLVLTITDDTGKQIRRLDSIAKDAGVHRLTWNLRPDPAPAAAGAVGGRGAGGGGGGGFGGGRGGGAMVDPGHYTATLGKLDGDKVAPIGKPQSFYVVPLPAKNW
jgi:photosystem II stability/assembly factor-like uncharacterized protein